MEAELKMLVYGLSGAGKTTLLGSAANEPRLTPGLVLDFEGGVGSILSKCRAISLDQICVAEPDEGRIDVVRIREWNDFDQAYTALQNSPEFYKFVAIDSLSEVNYLCLRLCVDLGVRAAKKPRDEEIPEVSDYQRDAIKMRELIRFFRDLPTHIVFTALANEVDGVMHPNLVGKLALELPGLLEIVGYLGVSTEPEKDGTFPRVLVTAQSPRFPVKDRSEGGKLQGQLPNPTLSKILDLLQGV